MPEILRKVRAGANDDQDMVVLDLGDIRARFPYQAGFEITVVPMPVGDSHGLFEVTPIAGCLVHKRKSYRST